MDQGAMEEIKRYHIVQRLVDQLREKRKVNYLEIGVQRGLCFYQIDADRKIAVDPKFIIDQEVKEKAYEGIQSNHNNVYFELTSDDFFELQTKFLENISGLDVVLIDGLHLYEQVLADVENSLKYLNSDGLLILHDCNPTFSAGAIRGYSPQEIAKTNPPGWNGHWHGDVWKAIVRLRSDRKDLEIQVVDTDFGIGIIRQGKPQNNLSFTAAEIDSLTYNDLEMNREQYLNLKNVSVLDSIYFPEKYAGDV